MILIFALAKGPVQWLVNLDKGFFRIQIEVDTNEVNCELVAICLKI